MTYSHKKFLAAFAGSLSGLFFLTISIASNAQDTFALQSKAFAEGKSIPVKYTCSGEDVSPELSWVKAPAATKSFALIMDDPDAPMGIWVHWVVYNIMATTNRLNESFKTLDSKAVDGVNSWGDKGYKGPCPPGGQHQYIFKLYALDAMLNVASDMTKEKLEELMKGHILAKSVLTGVFEAR